MKSYILGDITPCSPLKVNRRFRGTCRLHLQSRRISQVPYFMLVSCLVFSPTLKMETTCSSETSADRQRIIWRYIPAVEVFSISCEVGTEFIYMYFHLPRANAQLVPKFHVALHASHAAHPMLTSMFRLSVAPPPPSVK
jgi:hypothetical protein